METVPFLAGEAELALLRQMTIAWLLEVMQSPESVLGYKEWSIKAFCCRQSTKINKFKQLCDLGELVRINSYLKQVST